MEINSNIKAHLQFPAFYLFFIMFGVQTGVGIMGAPKYIFIEAKQDSWVAILLAYILLIIIVSVMLLILKQYEDADIFGIQVDIFGKWIGKLFGTIYILYFFVNLLSILLNYIEVIKVYLFPTISSFILGLLFIILIAYCVLGGIRTIVGMIFFFVILTQWILFLLYDPISRMDWSHFSPMFQASFPEILQGTKATTYSISGFELLFILYPFIQNKDKIKLPLFLGLGYTIFNLLLVTVISIGYFSPVDLADLDWPTLSLFKNVSYSFIERLDNIIIFEWIMVILPNLVLLMWGMTYGMKRIYNVSQKSTLYIASIMVLILIIFIQHDKQVTMITDTIAQFGFWLLFVYPLFLLPIVLIKKKWRRQREDEKN
ncbi:GerAB/ArcD/ProY family transporter [Oceanobacillus chungangensis]|uniref:Spore gernimation protein n=1 Tax=Oceanobacillus chungangensis TaxID=1229152 RepID=A0A3D8PUQ1_9BACI|nr:GerAB/ArcD/ProY family transporter [Oceanobacillus chungangensis]RDW19846.1 spore gernimation protein [Oceanobacillus chungangensis]